MKLCRNQVITNLNILYILKEQDIMINYLIILHRPTFIPLKRFYKKIQDLIKLLLGKELNLTSLNLKTRIRGQGHISPHLLLTNFILIENKSLSNKCWEDYRLEMNKKSSYFNERKYYYYKHHYINQII